MLTLRARLRCAAALALGGLLGPGAAALPLVPQLTITVTGGHFGAGGASVSVPLVETLPGSGVWLLNGILPGGNWMWTDDDLLVDPNPGAADFSIMLCNAPVSGSALCPTGVPGAGMEFDQDPFISYFGGVQDSGPASTFSFVFDQAIVATAAPGVASHDQSSSTTDGGSDGVTVTAGAVPAIVDPFSDDDPDQDGNAEIFVFSLSTDGGTSFLNAGLDLREGFTAPTPGGSENQSGLDETVGGPAGSGSYDFMRVDANFGLSGGDDIITFNGKAEIVEGIIPEPATAALLGLGLAGLAALGRRRD